MILGFFSLPDAVQVCRAHFLTHDAKYLAGAVQACQFPGGANPNNMTYTTGVGSNWPQHPLLLDSRRTGQPAPVGLTIYGNLDSKYYENQDWVTWPVKNYLVKVCTPSVWDWPVPEAYWDIFIDPPVNEFTVDMWAPNVYVWGYLAARA
jgi:endoglucanase